MSERVVSRQDIEAAIRNAHTVVRGSTYTYVGPVPPDGRELKVWAMPPGYVDEETTIIIKSTAWRN